MARGKFRKHVGPQLTGPAACWRSPDIKLACAKCGGRTSPMHSPTRLAGVFCSEHCPCCVPTAVSTVPAPGKALQAPLASSARHSALPRFWQLRPMRGCLGPPRGFSDKTYISRIVTLTTGEGKTVREEGAPRGAAPGGEGSKGYATSSGRF